MAKLENGFFWGVLAGATAIAVVGAMALTCSFRNAKVGGGSPEGVPKGRPGTVRRARRVPAKK